MSELLAGYHYEVDCSNEHQWHEAMRCFDDANIYQTWTYEAVRSGEKNMSHFALKKDGHVIAMAQARLLRIPIIKMGIAYIRWGPIWNLSGKSRDLEIFRQTIRGLRNEYVLSRGLALRLFPYLFEDEHRTFIPILVDEGYEVLTSTTAGRTLLMDLSSPMETLRKGLDRKWRRHLSVAETKGLSLVEGYGDDLFEVLTQLYDEMVERKKFTRPTDINEYREIQKKLPLGLKMRIMLCLSDGKPAAGALCSSIGNFGMNIYRATNDVGRKSKASYLLQWRIIEWVKEQNCSYYNVNGINPERNPGTYSFKVGLCGKSAKDVYYLGQFDSYRNAFLASLIKWPGKLRFIQKITKSKLLKKTFS